VYVQWKQHIELYAVGPATANSARVLGFEDVRTFPDASTARTLARKIVKIHERERVILKHEVWTVCVCVHVCVCVCACVSHM